MAAFCSLPVAACAAPAGAATVASSETVASAVAAAEAVAAAKLLPLSYPELPRVRCALFLTAVAIRHMTKQMMKTGNVKKSMVRKIVARGLSEDEDGGGPVTGARVGSVCVRSANASRVTPASVAMIWVI